MAEKTTETIDQRSAEQADPVKSSSSSELDETYHLYKQEDAANLDPDEAKRVLHKIDWHLIPLMMGTYMLQYLDKSSINFSSVFGLQKGTHLHGYLVAQYPFGRLLQVLPTARVIGVATFAWGILLLTTPACTNFAGIAANRFLLGVTEAVVNPGFVLTLSMWWRQSEQPLRIMLYYCMNGVAGIFGGLLGFAIGHINTGLAQWQYVFLIFGAISMVWAVVFTLYMPNLPSSARFLDQRERIVAVERVAANRQGVKNHHFKWYQFWQFARDPKTYILFFMSIAAQIPNAALGSFTSLILTGFGFTALQTQYMQIPGNVVQIVTLLASGYVGSRWPNMRCIMMLTGNLICVMAAGLLVGLSTDNKWGRLVAIWLCSAQSVGFAMSLIMVSSNVAGYTKKQLTNAAVFVGYCVGNIIGPQTFRQKEAPLYHSAYVAMLVGYSFKTILVAVLYVYMWKSNVKRDREAAAMTADEIAQQEKEAIEKGMQDQTEVDNRGFRYVL
ncbi:hypothetical protein LTR86_001629 [Recurvomyces mirabilis]|nr:hypothetical protein LTR86_001629 [Recurvomyces mirabilis]